MKLIYTFLLGFLFSFSISAQDYSSSWEGLYSYYNIIDTYSSNNRVFAAAQNSIFYYNNNSGEIEKISTINGISGEDISAIYYSSTYNLVLIGYETGLINVYDFDTQKDLQIIDITEKETVSPENRKINDFYEVDNKILISTNYGISVYDIEKLEFGDTYFIGSAGSQLEVSQVTVQNNTIYAATNGEGVKYVSLNNPNLIDFSQWLQVPNLTTVTRITVFNDKVICVSDANILYEIEQNSASLLMNLNGNVRDIYADEDTFYILYVTKLEVYNSQLNKTYEFGINNLEFTPSFSSVTSVGDDIFIGDANQGLIHTLSNNAVYEYLSPSGPLRNNVFNMEVIPNELWVVYGDYDVFYNPYPLESYGASHLDNDEWINIPYEDIGAKTLVNIAINPDNVDQVFISSFYDGLVQIEDNEIIEVYNQNNSPIEELINNGTAVANDTRVNGIYFDNSGRLWGNVTRVLHGLFSFTPDDNSFTTVDITSAIPSPDFYSQNLGFSDLIIDNSNNIYFGSYEYGLVGYQSSTGTFSRLAGESGNLPEDYVTTVALDNNNQLWIGTARGLRVLYSPSTMFSSTTAEAQEIIILDDDGVAQELLAGISIADIEVDGNNNKWIATESGVFYISSNGQETIYNFTTANSPLPSNSVVDVEVDNSSGEVYIGTDKGIVVFQGSATSSQETLENVRAYPNPVRPNYSGMVTIDGLIEGANVKITDIEGNLVYEEYSQGGSIQWDTRAFGKYKVASGVYLVLITSADQIETKVTKIMVIR
ncbi:Two component regulator propeller [Mesonia phycicola]|uniref:Two component regulator propeller n=1 Tax=Mesonia phycicola TaxID=579105 RepID=A0A1M6CSH4_9FLAO|nr:two-component regulator propeller domain-containing protein [Mesonia phycicola]SHI64045.1 Two component regulator propeller [Mesonia phycicola]